MDYLFCVNGVFFLSESQYKATNKTIPSLERIIKNITGHKILFINLYECSYEASYNDLIVISEFNGEYCLFNNTSEPWCFELYCALRPTDADTFKTLAELLEYVDKQSDYDLNVTAKNDILRDFAGTLIEVCAFITYPLIGEFKNKEQIYKSVYTLAHENRLLFLPSDRTVSGVDILCFRTNEEHLKTFKDKCPKYLHIERNYRGLTSFPSEK